MRLDRLRAEEERFGDLRVRPAVDDEPRDLKFARCQRLDAGSVGLAGLCASVDVLPRRTLRTLPRAHTRGGLVPEHPLAATAQLLDELKRIGWPQPSDPSVALPMTLVDVETVARYLGVSADYVYRHVDELGARRLPSAGNGRGKGTKQRLRFSLPELDERLQARTTCSASGGSERAASRAAAPVRRRRRRRSMGTKSHPLPIQRRERPA
jgi:hypothetical protein